MQPPRFEFYDQESPIYTSPRFLPPAKVVKSKINDAIISHGSYLEECTVSNAIIGLRSRIDKHAVIQVRLRYLHPAGPMHLLHAETLYLKVLPGEPYMMTPRMSTLERVRWRIEGDIIESRRCESDKQRTHCWRAGCHDHWSRLL